MSKDKDIMLIYADHGDHPRDQCQVCDACFLHVLATIDSIAGRRLSERRLKVPQKLFESLPIVVKAKPPSECQEFAKSEISGWQKQAASEGAELHDLHELRALHQLFQPWGILGLLRAHRGGSSSLCGST